MEKLIPAWDDKYKIHSDEVDFQHQELFKLGARAEEAFYSFVTREEIKTILTELFHYMKEHFESEERYMKEINYPYFKAHRNMHRIIIRDMSHLIQNIRTTNELKDKLCIALSVWIKKHILYHDAMIGKWVRQNQRKNSNVEGAEDENPEEKMIFIYSCSCYKVTHKLNYEEHIALLDQDENEVTRCKKCRKPLVFVEAKEQVQKGGHVSKVG